MKAQACKLYQARPASGLTPDYRINVPIPAGFEEVDLSALSMSEGYEAQGTLIGVHVTEGPEGYFGKELQDKEGMLDVFRQGYYDAQYLPGTLNTLELNIYEIGPCTACRYDCEGEVNGAVKTSLAGCQGRQSVSDYVP